MGLSGTDSIKIKGFILSQYFLDFGCTNRGFFGFLAFVRIKPYAPTPKKTKHLVFVGFFRQRKGQPCHWLPYF